MPCIGYYILISIKLSSKCCISTLSGSRKRTRSIHRVGSPQPRTCEPHTGTGPLTPSLPLKLSPIRPSALSHPMAKRPTCRTHSCSTPSIPLTHLSHYHIAVGKRRSDIPTSLGALT